MTQEDWTKMNEISHYKSLIKQDIEHRKLIRRLQLEKEDLKKQLASCNVVGGSERLKALEDLKQWCFETCQPFEEERLHDILKRL